MRKLFGTDGMRGAAGTPPLDPVSLYRLGRAVVASLEYGPRGDAAPPRICLRDGHPRVVPAGSRPRWPRGSETPAASRSARG